MHFKQFVHTYQYENNRLISENLPLSLGQVSYTYNPLVPLSVESPYHVQKIHSLDEANNVTLLESDKQLSFYTYDALSQVSSEEGLFSHRYVTDAHYRRLQKDEDEHTYDELNQLLSRSQALYTYTSSGCRESTNDTRYVYDALDRLIRIEKPSSTDTFTYDYFNRLISINGDILLYDGENEIGRFRNAEPLELRIIGAPSRSSALSATLLIQLGTETYIPLHDLYDNITHLLTLSGEVMHTSFFNPFGEERRTGLSANPWRYQSKRHMGSLVYFGERFYDINTALFLSPDPAGYSEGPNLYQYVHNNPLQLVDPSGAMIFYPQLGGGGLCSSQGAWTGTMAQRGVTDLGPCWYNPTFEKRLGPAANNYGIKESFSFKLCSPDHQGPLREATHKMGVDVYLKDPNRGPITLINGMGNVLIDNVSNAAHISKLLNHNVYSVYNATHGHRYDVMECCLGALGIATAPAIVLKEQWLARFREMPADQEILHFCHSQGAIHSKFALMLLPPELRSRINVVAIAPAIYIPNELCKSAINYVVRADWRKDPEHQQVTTLSFDPVPFLLNYVGKALALSPTMQKPELRTSYTYNVKFLDSHPDAPIIDHSFTSPTYIQSIKEHGIAFINGDL